MLDLFKLIGAIGILLIAIGILLISIGVLNKSRRKQNLFYILGGLCLEIYSIYIQDAIFIILQLIFLLAALWDFLRKH